MSIGPRTRRLVIFAFAALLSMIGVRVESTEPRTATLIISGNASGSLTSCGCNGSRPVGLPQQAGLVRALKLTAPTALTLDVSGVADAKWKEPAAMEAVGSVGYDAVAVQTAGKPLERTYVRAAAAWRVPLVGGRVQARWFVIGDAAREVVNPPAISGGALLAVVISGDGCAAGLSAIRSTIAAGHTRPDVLVCLGWPAPGVGCLLRDAREIAGPPCGIVIAGSPPPDARVEGGVSLVRLDPGGNAVSVALGTRTGSAWRWEARQHPITGHTEADPQVKAIIDRHYLMEQERFLVAQRQTGKSGGNEGDGVRVSTDLGYVPAWGCRNCHEEAFAQWQASRHAGAVKTLAGKNRLVAECIPCHSEEFRRTGKLSHTKPAAYGAHKPDGQQPPIEGGVECASCHGSSILHAALGTKDTVERGSLRGCVACHDAERSPKFDLAKYWETIRH